MKKKILSLFLAGMLVMATGCSASSTKSSSNIASSQEENYDSSVEEAEQSEAAQKEEATKEELSKEEDSAKEGDNKQEEAKKEDSTTTKNSSNEQAVAKEENNTKVENNKKDNSNSVKDDSNSVKTDNDKTDKKPAKKNGKYLICIDPGHQAKGDLSKEPVAPGSSEKKFKVSWGTEGVATGIPEYKLNLSASKILRDYLVAKGYDVIMTRETNNVNITNSERAIFANNAGADLVIRIHADGSENSSISGASLHIPSQSSKYTKAIYSKSNECAKIIFNDMQNAGFKINNIYQRSDLTGFNWSKVPVVLVEMGFMSNPKEDKKMADVSYQKKMMKCIANSVDKYFSK